MHYSVALIIVLSAWAYPKISLASEFREMMLLKVDKSTLQAELRTWPEDASQSRSLHRFRIAIGKAQGDKEREGDNKTPEGIYFTQAVIEDPGVPQKYGPRAIPLNFPNPIDKLFGKTGHGIWLHGAGDDQRIEASNVTEGCVAFYNADILRLTNWLKPFQAGIVISTDMEKINQADDVQAVMLATKAWAQAWAQRNTSQYLDFYHSSFEHNKMNRQAYGEYKSKVFTSYKEIEVKIDQIRIASHPKYAVAIMNQDFRGDRRFSAIGRKLLYWQKQNDGKWAIAREIYEDRRFEPLQYSEAEVLALSKTAQETGRQVSR